MGGGGFEVYVGRGGTFVGGPWQDCIVGGCMSGGVFDCWNGTCISAAVSGSESVWWFIILE